MQDAHLHQVEWIPVGVDYVVPGVVVVVWPVWPWREMDLIVELFDVSTLATHQTRVSENKLIIRVLRSRLDIEVTERSPKSSIPGHSYATIVQQQLYFPKVVLEQRAKQHQCTQTGTHRKQT